MTAIWKGKGQPVPTERIFHALQQPGTHGRQSHDELSAQFKFGLHRLRRKLAGSGVAVVSAGYARGWRVTFEASAKSGGMAAFAGSTPRRAVGA